MNGDSSGRVATFPIGWSLAALFLAALALALGHGLDGARQCVVLPALVRGRNRRGGYALFFRSLGWFVAIGAVARAVSGSPLWWRYSLLGVACSAIIVVECFWWWQRGQQKEREHEPLREVEKLALMLRPLAVLGGFTFVLLVSALTTKSGHPLALSLGIGGAGGALLAIVFGLYASGRRHERRKRGEA